MHGTQSTCTQAEMIPQQEQDKVCTTATVTNNSEDLDQASRVGQIQYIFFRKYISLNPNTLSMYCDYW